MNLLKIFTPEEIDSEKQKELATKRARALSAKEHAKESLSRFEHSLLELETILTKAKKEEH